MFQAKGKLELLLATGNAGKVRELAQLLENLPIRLRSLNEFEGITEPEETGATFAENAALKAAYYASQTGLHALADDSGLEVESLGGAPGIYSARYGGINASYSEKINYLLSEIEKSSADNRNARFVCAMAFADRTGDIEFLSEGICGGTIAAKPSGANGFGYDPVFVPEGYSETFGELSGEIKQKISHRLRAIEKIIRFLGHYTAD